MNDLTIIMTCVGFYDFLELTLPEAMKFGRVIVATSPKDQKTIEVVERCGAECFQTKAWYKNEAPFNKGAGLNATIAHVKPSGWLLLLDVDIILMPPPPQATPISELDRKCMYGVRRRNCIDEDTWRKHSEQRTWYELKIEALPPIIRKPRHKHQLRLWGHRPTSNPIGVLGFFQLWHYPTHPHGLFEHRTAAKYDVDLALKWPDAARKLLPWNAYSVIHLGPSAANWRGRQTKLWDIPEIPEGALEKAAAEYYAK